MGSANLSSAIKYFFMYYMFFDKVVVERCEKPRLHLGNGIGLVPISIKDTFCDWVALRGNR